jgi:uncharacterized protein YkwD
MPALSRMRGTAMKRVLSPMLLAAALLFPPGETRADDVDHIRAQALALLNQSRKEHDLPPLTLEAKLNTAAQGHASDMLKRTFFAHSSPEGKTAGDRYRQAGGSRWLITAENIAMFTHTPPPVTDNFLKHLQESWMNSPGHRKNILLRGITQFGFGIAVDARGELYAVQNFAGPGADTGTPGEVRPIGPQEQVALALAAINAERKKAGRAALNPNDALSKGALALLPAKGEEALSLDKKNILNLIPAAGGQSWGTVSVVAAMCGGCGTRPVAGDIGKFTGQWVADPRQRAMLLGSEVTHLGFAMSADGAGKKVAIGVLGKPH